MRIAIEGMDGAGKTTVAKALSQILGYSYVDKPFKFLFKNFGLTESQIKDIEWKLYETEDEALISLFYGMGLLYGTRCIDEKNIIYDRHFASNYYWHGNDETEKLHQQFLELSGIPDLTILLKATTATRMRRIALRDKLDRDLSNCSMYEDGYDKMEQYLKNNNFNYVVIDTEYLNCNEVIEKSLLEIRKSKENSIIKRR